MTRPTVADMVHASGRRATNEVSDPLLVYGDIEGYAGCSPIYSLQWPLH
jgi:hypothetical protein